MSIRRVLVADKEVVYVRGVFEASCGVAVVFSEKGGDLFIAALNSRARERDEILADLKAELCDGMWVAEAEESAQEL